MHEIARSYIDGEAVGRTLQRALQQQGWSEDQVDRLLSKGLREAAYQLLVAFRDVAQSPEPAPENPLREYAEVQDANGASARIYGAFSPSMGSREGAVWSDTERLAREARYKALRLYAQRADDLDTPPLDLTWVVLAVLGTQGDGGPTDFQLHSYLPQAGKAIGSYSFGHTRVLAIGYTWATLESSGPGIVGSLRVHLHARMNLVLTDVANRGLYPFKATASADIPEDFTIDRGPDQLLHASFGRRHPGGAIVPVQVEVLRQARQEDLGNYDRDRIVSELFNKHGYTRGGPDSQKRIAHKVVAYTKDRRIKWIKPDPFAP